MTRAPFRVLVPVTIGVIACGYFLSRADGEPADKPRDQQGLTGAVVSIRLKGSEVVYHVEHALIKSLGGQTFLTGNLLSVHDPHGQRPADKKCRAWVPVNDIQAMFEYHENPFKTVVGDPTADSN